MRKMFILRGAPGSGKTTFLQDEGLSEYAIGFDDARKLLSGPHRSTDGETRCVGSTVDLEVTTFIETAVRTRASRGETIFVDTTCAAVSDLRRWQRIAGDYGYEMIVVDVQGDLTDEELLTRNSARTSMRRVTDDTVTRIAEKVRSSARAFRAISRVITPDDVDDELIVPVEDFQDHDRVIVVGDVQGCATVLQTLIDQVRPTSSDAVVFVGDLFDRGVENTGVYRIITELRETTTVRIVAGNHDDHLYAVLKGTAGSRFVATRETLGQLTGDGIDGDDLLELVSGMDPYIAAKFSSDTELWITHGGIVGLDEYRVIPDEDLPLGGYRTGMVPDRWFMYGSSTREKVYLSIGDYDTDIAEMFADRYAGAGVLAFHGHRPVPEGSGGGISFGLESSVEFDGGKLSAAVVSRGPDGTVVETIAIDNPVTCGPKRPIGAGTKKPARPGNGLALVASLRSSGLIREKVIDDTLSAFNFTREAFAGGEWNTLTTTARGLFLDPRNGKVAGRGYGKFFNIGERPETALSAVVSRFSEGTVRVEQKLNGFLGLAFVHEGELKAFSKSGTSAFADEFSRILENHLGDRLGEFTAALEASKVTLTFEVLSGNDPHIVDDGEGLVLLHAVARTVDRTLLLDVVADRYGADYGFRRPQIREITGAVELQAAIADAAASDGEGAVFRHLPSGEMVKIKSDSYRAWKSLRAGLNRAAVDREPAGRSPRDAAVAAVGRELSQRGMSLKGFLVSTIGGPWEVDIPALREVVGDIPEVIGLADRDPV